MNSQVTYVHFLVDANRERYESVSYALFEMSCRAGLRFKVSWWSAGKEFAKDDNSLLVVFSTKSTSKHAFLLQGEPSVAIP